MRYLRLICLQCLCPTCCILQLWRQQYFCRTYMYYHVLGHRFFLNFLDGLQACSLVSLGLLLKPLASRSWNGHSKSCWICAGRRVWKKHGVCLMRVQCLIELHLSSVTIIYLLLFSRNSYTLYFVMIIYRVIIYDHLCSIKVLHGNASKVQHAADAPARTSKTLVCLK